MSLLPRPLLPLVTAALLASAGATPLPAEALPERRCGMDRAAVLSTPHPVPALPASDAAFHLTVLFETGSAILSPDARRALDQAAPEVVAHLARGGSVRVEGHAEAAPADEIDDLSLRRARAVAAYLEAAWGIRPHRLALRGWGSVLADGRDLPRTAENRRATLVLDAGLPAVARVHRSWPTVPRTDHLDLDDFGGARNPLAGPIVRIWTAPNPRHD
jgi:outer membrane protein OmpA-like peptidoglycan-associated protein